VNPADVVMQCMIDIILGEDSRDQLLSLFGSCSLLAANSQLVCPLSCEL